MKILHFSDLHIGVENYGRLDPATGLSTRMADFLNAFDQLVDYAIENHVDLVLFAGDAYKSREPNQTQQREFARRIARLASAGVHVFLLVGNHDLPHALARATAVEIFDTLTVHNVTVADRAGAWRIDTPSGPLQIVAIPWPRRSLLLAREATKNLNFQELNQEMERIITERIYQEAQKLVAATPSFLTIHGSISSAALGSERTMMVGSDHVLLLGSVALPQFDYVALGHIHKMQVLNQKPPVVYCGSLQRVDFSEEHDDKGFYVIEVDPSLPQGQRVTGYHFQKVEARPFVTIDVAIKPDDLEPTQTVIKQIEKRTINEAVVRLRIKVPANLEPAIRDSELRKALKDAHYIAAIAKDVERERTIRLKDSGVEAMTPLEALQAYLDLMAPSRGWSEQRKQELLAHGQSLIQELTAPEE